MRAFSTYWHKSINLHSYNQKKKKNPSAYTAQYADNQMYSQNENIDVDDDEDIS